MPTYPSCFLDRPRCVRRTSADGVYKRLYTPPVVYIIDTPPVVGVYNRYMTGTGGVYSITVLMYIRLYYSVYHTMVRFYCFPADSGIPGIYQVYTRDGRYVDVDQKLKRNYRKRAF